MIEFSDVISKSMDQNAFDKYFPRLTIGWTCRNNRCNLWPFKLSRVFSLENICYHLPSEIKLPLCGGHKVIFSKHAIERLALRCTEQSCQTPPKPSVRAFFFSTILEGLARADYEITYLDGIPHLHCFGAQLETVCLGRGHFPLIIKDQYAVAKTFLYDEWLGSTITN